MKVLIDTSIWFLALCKNKQPASNIEVVEFRELIEEVRVQLIGPIRQEILSGVKRKQQFSKLKKILSAFPDLPLASEDFELAAEYFNTLRSKGIQGSNTDCLICAVSTRNNMPIFSIGNDFNRYKKHIPIALHAPRMTKKLNAELPLPRLRIDRTASRCEPKLDTTNPPV
ncbi:MAG: PIN domain-containing protein [Deltaproteobacteria bacterium]|nr:PIN domain-containing protein [Deltaproteobacteria bacterium]